MDIATEGAIERKTCIVVNEKDETQYIGGLADCHVRPMTLHRAFSLFVFDQEGRLLLQQRAKTKYTFPLAWTNTVCSHPRTEEKPMEEWIDIRVQDELGWAIKDVQSRLTAVGKLTYSAYSDFKYGEKEVDTLYFLEISEDEKQGLELNRDEVEAIDWVEPERLASMLQDDRFLITPWFRAIANGFGFPFYNKIKAVQETVAKSEGLDAADEEPQEPESESKEGSRNGVNVASFVDPKTSVTLPWFQVGNVSIPSANASSELLLQQPFSYLCSNPGKALRTQLVKLYAELDDGVSASDVEGLCWIVERVHNASLLHDDIEDRSSSRRGAVCAHLLWGTAQTINTGTFNFLRAVQGVDAQLAHRDEATRSAVMRQTLDMLVNLHIGQNADIVWGEHAMCPTISQYVEMIDHKTGALFRACADLGALCSGNKEVGRAAANEFVELARFFQIRDDLCNVCDPAYWKAKGFYEDADEGKYSYPVLLYFEQPSDEEDQAWLRDRLANKEEPMSLEEKLKAYELLYSANALQATKTFLDTKLANLRASMGAKSQRASLILDLLPVVDILAPEAVKLHLQTL